jgi:hypothetical protein
VPTDGRRWDTDEHGHGVGPGDAFSPNVRELADALPGSGWVAEEPEAHLLPHLRAACDEPGSRWAITSWTIDDDGVFVVGASWSGSWGAWDALRGDAFAFLGRIAEVTTHIRQRTVEDGVVFEMATGTVADETPFVPHGHLIRLHVPRPAISDH